MALSEVEVVNDSSNSPTRVDVYRSCLRLKTESVGKFKLRYAGSSTASRVGNNINSRHPILVSLSSQIFQKFMI